MPGAMTSENKSMESFRLRAWDDVGKNGRITRLLLMSLRGGAQHKTTALVRVYSIVDSFFKLPLDSTFPFHDFLLLGWLTLLT